MRPEPTSSPSYGLAGVVEMISEERFARYRAAQPGNDVAALELYAWNVELCGAFYFPLQAVEVGFRNSCHAQLTRHFGSRWPWEKAFLAIDRDVRSKVERASERLGRRDDATTADVVATLEFGFWTTLLDSKLTDAIWIPALSHAFPNHRRISGRAIARKTAATAFRSIRRLRNRIFHHEPIFEHRSLHDDLETILTATAWISSDLHAWARLGSRRCAELVARGRPERSGEPPRSAPPEPTSP